MPEIVMKLELKRDRAFLYFLRGNEVYRVPAGKSGAPELVARGEFVPDPDYLYYLDGAGDVVRAYRGGPPSPPRPVPPPLDARGLDERAAAQLRALEALARLIARDDADAVIAEVRQAAIDPPAYAAAFAADLERRGADEADPQLALLDGLGARDRLHEVDWKAADDDIDFALRHLRHAWPGAPPQLALDEDRPTLELLALADERVARHGLRLAALQYGADSYALFLLEPAQLDQARALAVAAGFEGVDTFR